MEEENPDSYNDLTGDTPNITDMDSCPKPNITDMGSCPKPNITDMGSCPKPIPNVKVFRHLDNPWGVSVNKYMVV
jgi:hypothetical protein